MMKTTTAVVLLFTTSAILLAASAQPPPPSSSSSPGCVDELVAFSPCLSYVSAPPNNITETAASECCDTVSSALNSSNRNCLCYLLRQPLIFSFPLNQTRVASLPLVCNTSRSLDSICSSASPALPPLRNTTDSENSKPSDSATGHHHYSAGSDDGQAPSIRSPAQPAKNSSATFSFPQGNSVGSLPTTPSSSVQLLRGSFTTKQVFNCSWLFSGMLIFPIIFIHNIP